MQLGMSERREGWGEGGKIDGEEETETETRQIEVRDRNQPGKRDKHALSGHILHPHTETLKYSETARLQEAPGFAVPSVRPMNL